MIFLIWSLARPSMTKSMSNNCSLEEWDFTGYAGHLMMALDRTIHFLVVWMESALAFLWRYNGHAVQRCGEISGSQKVIS